MALERTLLILVPNMEMSLPIVNISLLSIPNGRMSIDQAEIFDYDRWYSCIISFLMIAKVLPGLNDIAMLVWKEI